MIGKGKTAPKAKNHGSKKRLYASRFAKRKQDYLVAAFMIRMTGFAMITARTMQITISGIR